MEQFPDYENISSQADGEITPYMTLNKYVKIKPTKLND